MSLNGPKILNANGNYAHKNSLRPSSHIIKMQKLHGWPVRATLMRKNRSNAEVNKRKILVRKSAEGFAYGEIAADFFICDRHLQSGVTLQFAFRHSIDDFVIMTDDAAKQYKVKNVEAKFACAEGDP